MSDFDPKNEIKGGHITYENDDWVEVKKVKKTGRRKEVYIYSYYNYTLAMQSIGLIFIWIAGVVYMPHNPIPCIGSLGIALAFIMFGNVAVSRKVYVEK